MKKMCIDKKVKDCDSELRNQKFTCSESMDASF